MFQALIPFLTKTVLPMVLSSVIKDQTGGAGGGGGLGGMLGGGQEEKTKAPGIIDMNKPASAPINLMGFPSMDKNNFNYGQVVNSMLKNQRGF